MHGDFSRWTYDPSRHYTAVLKQQGRVEVDADANEQAAILQHLRRTSKVDVVGRCGVPLDGGGFKINATVEDGGPKLRIEPGRIYVDGILCELGRPDDDLVDYADQPDYQLTTAETESLKLPENGTERTDLVYLDVWQRLVSAVEEPSLRDVALGGPDTTTRLQTICQVKVEPDVEEPDASCEGELPERLMRPGGGRLSARAEPPDPSTDPCVIAPGGGYRGLENRLYRVEIHRPGDVGGAATFKWSRDNGAITYRIASIEAPGETSKAVQLERFGGDQLLALREDDWVEVLDDQTEHRGEAGPLAKVKEADSAEGRVTFKTDIDLSAFEVARNARLRRWDGVGEEGEGLPVTTAETELEDGVYVQFSGKDLRVGDYWFFTARAATAEVETLEDAPPQGIEHHYCRLALVQWSLPDSGEAWEASVTDCRPQFPPLTALTTLEYVGGDGQEAMPGSAVPHPLEVRVLNGGYPVENAAVTLEVVEGEGRLGAVENGSESLTVVTNSDGLAACAWRLDAEMAAQRVQATLEGRPDQPIAFNAQLSRARDVSYDPTACETLQEAGADTVQAAIDTLCKGVQAPAIRVTDVQAGGSRLLNDAPVSVSRLKKGIEIVCTDTVDPQSVKRPTCFVTVEMPEFDQGGIAADRPYVLRGEVEANGDRIHWTPLSPAIDWLTGWVNEVADDGPLLGWLTLKGNFIWAKGEPRRSLDGETFGVPDQGRIGLELDRGSGDGHRGGDFEMWFCVTTQEQTGGPVIKTDPSDNVIDFGDVDVGGSKTHALTVTNAGDATLNVENMTISTEHFKAEPQNFELGPEENVDAKIVFTPPRTGPRQATLQINSNDPVNPKLTFKLQGKGVG